MNDLFIKINKLPDELIDLIKEYILIKNLVFVNKNSYLSHHFIIKSYILNYENYIRYMIRRDFDFVFEQIIRENYKKWSVNKNYVYKNMVYKNYIYFIINFCIENDSPKCRFLLTNFLKEHGLCKNLHKKNIVKYIKWKN
jgi:hypothetical protein